MLGTCLRSMASSSRTGCCRHLSPTQCRFASSSDRRIGPRTWPFSDLLRGGTSLLSVGDVRKADVSLTDLYGSLRLYGDITHVIIGGLRCDDGKR